MSRRLGPKAKKRRQIQLSDGDVRPFVPMTKNYGRAEFTFCPVWIRRKLQEVFIYPRQQENIDYFYRVKSGYSDSFQVSSWSYKGFENPKIWLHFYCKDHKCMSMNVYPPHGCDSLRVNTGSTLAIYFEKQGEKP
jgi:hypothetical protein